MSKKSVAWSKILPPLQFLFRLLKPWKFWQRTTTCSCSGRVWLSERRASMRAGWDTSHRYVASSYILSYILQTSFPQSHLHIVLDISIELLTFSGFVLLNILHQRLHAVYRVMRCMCMTVWPTRRPTWETPQRPISASAACWWDTTTLSLCRLAACSTVSCAGNLHSCSITSWQQVHTRLSKHH